jgi:transposase
MPVAWCLAAFLCRDRSRSYPSDLTDEQWLVLRPEAEAVMAELRRGPGGAPMQHDLRAMLDGIGYVTRYGIEWRAMPRWFCRTREVTFKRQRSRTC